MTPQQADKLLQEIGLFEIKSGPHHYEKSVQLIEENNIAPSTFKLSMPTIYPSSPID
jgi:hypothetical protein